MSQELKNLKRSMRKKAQAPLVDPQFEELLKNDPDGTKNPNKTPTPPPEQKREGIDKPADDGKNNDSPKNENNNPVEIKLPENNPPADKPKSKKPKRKQQPIVDDNDDIDLNCNPFASKPKIPRDVPQEPAPQPIEEEQDPFASRPKLAQDPPPEAPKSEIPSPKKKKAKKSKEPDAEAKKPEEAEAKKPEDDKEHQPAEPKSPKVHKKRRVRTRRKSHKNSPEPATIDEAELPNKVPPVDAPALSKSAEVRSKSIEKPSLIPRFGGTLGKSGKVSKIPQPPGRAKRAASIDRSVYKSQNTQTIPLPELKPLEEYLPDLGKVRAPKLPEATPQLQSPKIPSMRTSIERKAFEGLEPQLGIPQSMLPTTLKDLYDAVNHRLGSLVTRAELAYPEIREDDRLLLTTYATKGSKQYELDILTKKAKELREKNKELKEHTESKEKTMNEEQYLEQQLQKAQKYLQVLKKRAPEGPKLLSGVVTDEHGNPVSMQAMISKENSLINTLKKQIADLETQLEKLNKRVDLMTKPRSIYDVALPQTARKQSTQMTNPRRIVQPAPKSSRVYSKSPKRPIQRAPLKPLPPPIDA